MIFLLLIEVFERVPTRVNVLIVVTVFITVFIVLTLAGCGDRETPPAADDARVELCRRWLRAFGPGPDHFISSDEDHRLHAVGGRPVLGRDLDLQLRKELDLVLGAPIRLGLALLASEPFDFCYRHAFHAHIAQGILYLFELERFDNGGDLFHWRLREMGQQMSEETSSNDYVIRVLDDPAAVDAAQWNALLAAQPDGTPFMRHEYLAALHESASAVADTGSQSVAVAHAAQRRNQVRLRLEPADVGVAQVQMVHADVGGHRQAARGRDTVACAAEAGPDLAG